MIKNYHLIQKKCFFKTFSMCHNKQCIFNEKVCDNYKSCFDSSDEKCFREDAIDAKYKKSEMIQ